MQHNNNVLVLPHLSFRSYPVNTNMHVSGRMHQMPTHLYIYVITIDRKLPQRTATERFRRLSKRKFDCMPSLHRQEERSFASHRIHHVQPKKRVSYKYADASISVFLQLPY
jgi:hypothetical protein